MSQPISADSKLNPKGQKEQSSTIPEIRNNISRNENVNKDQFKISIENKTGLSNYQFTELKYTKSGRLAMELNEQLIDMIEKKSLEDPSLFISLKKTSSGNLLVDFNAKENEVDNTHKVSIRRTSSGTRLLDIHKDVISLLKGSLDNKSDASILKSIKLATIPKKQDGSNQVRKDRAEASTSQPHDKNSEKHTSERKKDKKSHKDISRLVDSMLKSSEEFQLKKLQRTDKIDRQKLPRQDISSVFEFRSELKKLYKEGNTDVAVQIKGKDGEVQTFSTVVTKTTSGTIAIYVDNMTSLKYISFMNNEYPVFLSKISSNSYFVNFDKNGRVFNAIVRKSPSGGMLIIPESRTFIEMHSMSHINDRDLKLTIIGLQTQPLALPAILQTTPSLNYIIGLNENNKKNELLNEFMRDKKDLVVDLHKTSSGNYIIDLNIDDESDLIKQKALIYKSSSGDVKVLIQKDIFESIANLVSLDSLPNDYSHAIGKFPTSSREIHRGNLRKSKLASSDSQVYDNLKVQDKKGIFTEPQTVLRKTESGQYAAILDKDSKKVFMHNLKSFLSTNSEGLIPIKRSDSGKIIIDLNSSGKFKGHNGTLKITSSGNIYVVVDEEVMKSMTKRAKNKENHADVDTRSQQVTDLICSVSKAITTTCNAHPEDCDCDATKCVCSELQLDTFDWLTGFNPKKTKSHHKSGSFHAKKRSGVAKSSSRDKPPHIVIKPNCECEPKSKNIGCYFLVDSVCPYHQHIYDDVSNEILEITGLCNPNKKPSKNKIEFEAINNIPNEGKGHQAWDSLSYLPPQLPPFLNLDYH